MQVVYVPTLLMSKCVYVYIRLYVHKYTDLFIIGFFLHLAVLCMNRLQWGACNAQQPEALLLHGAARWSTET